MPAKSIKRGRMVASYTVHCGLPVCTVVCHRTTDAALEAESHFIRAGWARVEPHGWLCPQHAAVNGFKPLPVIPNIENLSRGQLIALRETTAGGIAAARVNCEPDRIEALQHKLKAIEGELLKRQYSPDF